MIEIRNLVKRFGTLVAVNDVSFSVQKGEVLGFLGPNGAGKSTTMKMVTGFLEPTAGTATVCGHDIRTASVEAKSQIGYLPEGAPLYPDMTPLGLLKFAAEIRGLSGSKRRSGIDQAVQRTHIESVLYQPVDTLSKGFKRRVGLAQAILHDPPVLILDEPTDGLDPNQKHEVRRLIAEMAADKVIVLSTHILEEVDAVCTRAIIISSGRLLFDGQPEELKKKSPRHNAIFVQLQGADSSQVQQGLKTIAGVTEVQEEAAANGTCRFLVVPEEGRNLLGEISQVARNNNWNLTDLRLEQGRLDDVFRQLTTKS